MLKKYPNTINRKDIIASIFNARVILYSTELENGNNSPKNIDNEIRVSGAEYLKQLGLDLLKLDSMHFMYNDIASGFLKTKCNLDLALELEKKAIGILNDPQNIHVPEYYLTLGKIYLELGKYTESLTGFLSADSVIRKIPDENYQYIDTKIRTENEIRINIGRSYMLNSNTENALDVFADLYKNNFRDEEIAQLFKNTLIRSGKSEIETERELKEIENKKLSSLRNEVQMKRTNLQSFDFTLKSSDNKDISLSNYKGKVVLLNFWAGWCAPCLKEMPFFVELYEKYSNEPFEILAVNIDNANTAKPFEELIRDYKIKFPLLKGNGEIDSKYGVSSIPVTCILDKNGLISYRHLGYNKSSEEQIIFEIEYLLKQ